MAGVHLEVMLAVAYAAVLVATAVCLELLARRSHERSDRYPQLGFVYSQERDTWACPMNQSLIRLATDPHRRVVQYRASADTCNTCAAKIDCTESDSGRVLERREDSWLESELRRFHRGISLTLLVLATIILMGAMIRHPDSRDVLIVVSLLAPVGAVEVKLWSSFLTHAPDTREGL